MIVAGERLRQIFPNALNGHHFAGRADAGFAIEGGLRVLSIDHLQLGVPDLLEGNGFFGGAVVIVVEALVSPAGDVGEVGGVVLLGAVDILKLAEDRLEFDCDRGPVGVVGEVGAREWKGSRGENQGQNSNREGRWPE